MTQQVPAAGAPESSKAECAPLHDQALRPGATDRHERFAAAAAAGLAFCLYVASIAPGITWAHQGADGGELLAAAVTNGVPHPPGYPLYMILLRGWLALSALLAPLADLAWRGNLFSALCAAASVGMTVLVASALLPAGRWRWLWAFCAGISWAVSPLLWGQALITEVYALHALIVTLLGWALLVNGSGNQSDNGSGSLSDRSWWLLAIPFALGTAHHITIFLLLPAVLFYLWRVCGSWRSLLRAMGWIALGIALGALFYLRIPLVAPQTAPVNWGYVAAPETLWNDLWWLVSGQAYRAYLFAAPTSTMLSRLAGWAYTLAMQYTPLGLLLAMFGLALWDMHRPHLRTFALLWVIPLSTYSLGYYTRDSEIYLLPVTWMLALLLAVGLQQSAALLAQRLAFKYALPQMLGALWLLLMLGASTLQWQHVALRTDHAARDFLAQSAQILEPDSIIVSRGDNETFALWYGTWGSGELLRNAPGLVVVNDSLYQFDWYRRLQQDLYPDLPGVATSAPGLLERNWQERPVFFAEELPVPMGTRLQPEPPLWRLVADE